MNYVQGKPIMLRTSTKVKPIGLPDFEDVHRESPSSVSLWYPLLSSSSTATARWNYTSLSRLVRSLCRACMTHQHKEHLRVVDLCHANKATPPEPRSQAVVEQPFLYS
mmetsp:Transcript_35425/g.53269  ORF Transcript_35425/g.53269 Transcript_35425/m.53269 type:complete len:108 (-) Transcript_35425:363-686(-)